MRVREHAKLQIPNAKNLGNSGSIPRKEIGEIPKKISLHQRRNFAKRVWSPPAMGLEMRSSRELDEWDEAYRRVESYLQACGVAPRLLLTELAVNLIERARERAAAEPTNDLPVTLAMRELFSQMTEGFGRAIQVERASDEQLRARGRLAVATSGVTPQWARLMVSKQAETEKIEPMLDDRPLQAGPELRLSKLPPAQIEYAFGDTDDDTSYVSWRIPVSAMALALSVVGAMGAVWAAIH